MKANNNNNNSNEKSKGKMAFFFEKPVKQPLVNNRIPTSLALLDYPYSSERITTLCDALQNNHTLISLEINNLTTDELVELCTVLHNDITLKALNLNIRSDEGIHCITDLLQKNDTISSLALSCTDITDKGITAISDQLKTNYALISLEILANYNMENGNGIKAVSKALQKNTTLTSFSLTHAKLGNAGAKSLSEMLQHNNSLTSLDLSYNLINVTGVTHLSSALKVNTTLKKLNLSQNIWSYSTVVKILPAMFANNITLISLKPFDRNLRGIGSKDITRYLKNNQALQSSAPQSPQENTNKLLREALQKKNEIINTLKIENKALLERLQEMENNSLQEQVEKTNQPEETFNLSLS